MDQLTSSPNRREQLVDAAVRIGMEKGLNAVTTRAVADVAGVSLGAVHYHFDSKNCLIAAMGHRLSRGWLTAVGMALEVGRISELEWDELSRVLTKTLLAQAKQHLDQLRLILEVQMQSVRNAALADAADFHINVSLEQVETFVTCLYEATGNECAVPIPSIAPFVLSVCDGIELAWITQGDDERYLTSYRQLLGLLKTLIKPSPDAPAAPAELRTEWVADFSI